MKDTIRNIDFWGTTTSLLCAIHCAILPVILSYGYIKASSFMSHPLFEGAILSITAILVFFSIILPYLKYRHNPISFYMALAGITMVILHHILPSHTTFIIVLGGVLIATSHLFNLFTTKKD